MVERRNNENRRRPVRLGKHGDEYIFKRVVSLRGDATGIAVAVVDANDPEILFEEHGLGQRCCYFELLGDDVQLNEDFGPTKERPEIAERVSSEHWPTKLHALQAAFALESSVNVNAMMASMKDDLVPGGGGVFLIRDYRCVPAPGADPAAVRSGDDADDAGWFTADEVRALTCTPGLVEALEEWGVLAPRSSSAG